MLQQLSIYLLKVLCISGLLFLYYHIALRNKRFHFYNRFYLLMAIVISAVLPALQLQWFTLSSDSPQTIHLLKIIYGNGENDITVTGNKALSIEQILLYVLALISICSLVVLAVRIIKIHRLKKQYPVQKLLEFDFVNTDISVAPFSFFKNIFWRNDIDLNDETGRQILQHEIAHIKQKHSWDKLFMQSIMCFYWMNPFYYLMKKELYLIHEFIADEKAIEHSDADAFAKMLLTAQFGKFNFLPAQPIFYSSIKRRLIMLTTSKKPQLSYLRRMLVLPLIASLVCLFAFTIKTKNSNVKNAVTTVAKPFVLVVDAGHGGKDNGAFGNGLNEKDITLKIAEKIKDLSSQYEVNVVLTRSSDEYMSPQEKSNFANTKNANAFVSIHINSQEEKQSSKSGFEVVLSARNEKLLPENQVLGSAILQSLNKDFKAEQVLQQKKAGIWVLENSTIPSALIECGYLTNAGDANLLKDDAKIELMAKNILQGVAMYANNSFDKSKLYQLDNAMVKDTNAPRIILDKPQAELKNQPLYIVDKKLITEDEFKKIDPATIESVSVWKDKDAIDKYGQKGKNGVIDITLKKAGNSNPPVIVRDTNFVEASFPGGNDGWRQYLAKNLDASIPAKRNAPKGIYTVTVSFKIDESGKVSEVKAVKDPGFGTAEEAVRIIAQGPNWVPAKTGNTPTVAMEKQNISFSIN